MRSDTYTLANGGVIEICWNVQGNPGVESFEVSSWMDLVRLKILREIDQSSPVQVIDQRAPTSVEPVPICSCDGLLPHHPCCDLWDPKDGCEDKEPPTMTDVGADITPKRPPFPPQDIGTMDQIPDDEQPF